MAITIAARRSKTAKLAVALDTLYPGWHLRVPADFDLMEPSNCIGFWADPSPDTDYYDVGIAASALAGIERDDAFSEDETYHDLWVDEINTRRRDSRRKLLPYRGDLTKETT